MTHPKTDRQREHQANERTFLAWLRTSISLIGFGFAIARFGLFLRQLNIAITQQEVSVHPLFNSQNLGLTLVVLGILVIAVAAWHYNQVYWQIERGNYQANRVIIWIMTGVVMFLGILSIPLLFWRDRTYPSRQQPQSRNRGFHKPIRNSQFVIRNYVLSQGFKLRDKTFRLKRRGFRPDCFYTSLPKSLSIVKSRGSFKTPTNL